MYYIFINKEETIKDIFYLIEKTYTFRGMMIYNLCDNNIQQYFLYQIFNYPKDGSRKLEPHEVIAYKLKGNIINEDVIKQKISEKKEGN